MLDYLIISSYQIAFLSHLTSHSRRFFPHNGLILSGPRDLIIASRDGTLVILRFSLPREGEREGLALYRSLAYDCRIIT